MSRTTDVLFDGYHYAFLALERLKIVRTGDIPDCLDDFFIAHGDLADDPLVARPNRGLSSTR